MTVDITSLQNGYRNGNVTPADVVRQIYARIRLRGKKPVWIHLIPEDEVLAMAEQIGPFRDDLPLYGLPFAIKDNIDLAGVPTTAACRDYSYTPNRSATVVERLIAAGALPLGKTNLDQFATGLVGTRSPYGACSSVFDERYISGGSSSGSAVAVAAGQATFSLGTDTAGSGRVPAAFNGIVGLKPTRGLLSTAGVVPACRTLDCVSIFATGCADAARVLQVAQGFNPQDAWSRMQGQQRAWPPDRFRFGVPNREFLRFFGDGSAPALFEAAACRLEALGGVRVEFDYRIFADTASLLYSGPWVAERLAAIRDFAGKQPEALHPVTAQIILPASGLTAVAAFDARYRLAELARAAKALWSSMDFALLPTAGNCYTHDEVAAEPLARNTDLGYYTNFVNLLDLAAVAIPAGMRSSGMPFGVTVMAPAWSDAALLSIADRLHRAYRGEAETAITLPYCPDGYVALAVCGAHLRGQPLNSQLTSAGAFLIEETTTDSGYRLYALQNTLPAKPGLIRDANGGTAIQVEVWAVPEQSFGRFVAAVPPPLGIGTCTLQSGRAVKSFICEPWALAAAKEITAFGGWRAWLSSVAG